MPTQRVANTASAVVLTLATEVAVATVTPQPPNNQVLTGGGNTGIQVQASIVITGAASATTCTLKVRRGAGITGADILPSDVVLSVPASAIDTSATITVQDSQANFNAANGIYTLTATAAGAAQSARIASIEIQDLAAGV